MSRIKLVNAVESEEISVYESISLNISNKPITSCHYNSLQSCKRNNPGALGIIKLTLRDGKVIIEVVE